MKVIPMPDPLKAKVRPSIADHSKSTRARIMKLLPHMGRWYVWNINDGDYSPADHERAASIAMNLETDDMPPDMAERWKQS